MEKIRRKAEEILHEPVAVVDMPERKSRAPEPPDADVLAEIKRQMSTSQFAAYSQIEKAVASTGARSGLRVLVK